ncbi:MAG: hypothetical protein WCF85_02675 [Rhodospirillaceae bacterium]
MPDDTVPDTLAGIPFRRLFEAVGATRAAQAGGPIIDEGLTTALHILGAAGR